MGRLIGFKAWLAQFATEDSIVGDLAIDVGASKDAPSHSRYEDWDTYLTLHHACRGAHEALAEAFDRYAAYCATRSQYPSARPRNKERAKMSYGLRYRILERDQFACAACGATADDGIKLHVDHIVPVSKGGRTEESNLQVLCAECNLGKFDRMPS